MTLFLITRCWRSAPTSGSELAKSPAQRNIFRRLRRSIFGAASNTGLAYWEQRFNSLFRNGGWGGFEFLIPKDAGWSREWSTIMRVESQAALRGSVHESLGGSVAPANPTGLKELTILFFLTACAILVHGYHPFVEDAEIYVPGIRKLLNPALYPYNDGFFASHARMTLFPNLIAWSVRITHLPLESVPIS